MEATRAQLWDRPVGPFAQRFFNRLAFQWVFPHRELFRLAFRALALYQRSGAQRMLRRSGLLARLSSDLARQEALLPELDEPFFETPQTIAPRRPGVFRVGFVAGCVMSTAFGDVQRATVRVLERAGCQVVIPPEAGCCGALNVHAGERHMAKKMARRLIESMMSADMDAVVINSAGCGSTMKEYHELFADEPIYLPRVRRFEGMVRDLGELLVELQFDRVLAGLPAADGIPPVVYQDACHLRHAQRITGPPRQLLLSIPGVELVELAQPDQCCGSAGVYNLEHPALSERILSPKLVDIEATGAKLVVSGNPGCIMQLRKGAREAGLTVRIEHLATVLDRALEGDAFL
jgi:glycolate oxidase iron-sulfur subunit